MSIFTRNKPCLIVPDLHAPYQHKDAIAFLREQHKKFGCDEEVVDIGDIFDFQAISTYTKEPDAPTAKEEYARALKFSKEFCRAFPRGVLVLGNHDRRPSLRAKELGIPADMMKTYIQLLGLGSGWRVEPLCHVIKRFDVLCEHGDEKSGPLGAINTAIYKRCSFVMGHAHSEAGVHYSANHKDLIFGLNVGCLVDNTSIAMAYGVYKKKKGVLGCGIVFSQCSGIFVPMEIK